MFELLPRDVFYKIFKDFNAKQVCRLLRTSRYFKIMLDQDAFWLKKIHKVAKNLQSHHCDLSDLDALLTAAASLGLSKYVQRYIDDKANVNVQLSPDSTMSFLNPINHAALSGNFACVKLLIEHGAIFLPQKPTDSFNSPLHYAVASGNVECVRLFLKAGVPVDQGNARSSILGWGWTPLEVAASFNRVGCYKLLRSYRAKVHSTFLNDPQAIHLACARGAIEVLRLLLADHADVNVSDEDGVTPLTIACRRDDHKIVSELLRHGADARRDMSIVQSWFPLGYCLYKGNYNTAKVLLDFDPTLVDFSREYYDVNAQSRERDETTLHILASKGNIDAIRFILPYRPDPHVLYKNQTAFEIAMENGHLDCADLLQEYAIERDFNEHTIDI